LVLSAKCARVLPPWEKHKAIADYKYRFCYNVVGEIMHQAVQ
jgi:hypothetical protein